MSPKVLDDPESIRKGLNDMRYRKSDVSAGQIVQAAIRVIARQGYARTSLLDIAKEAGMSKGAIHYHFPTKEALIDVVLKTACDAVQSRTIVAWERGGGPFEALHSALETLWSARAERNDDAVVVADLLAQSLYDERLKPHLAEFYRLAANQIHEHLTSHFFALGIRPRISEELLPRLVIGLLDGLVMQHFVDPGVLDPKDVVAAVEALGRSLFEAP